MVPFCESSEAIVFILDGILGPNCPHHVTASRCDVIALWLWRLSPQWDLPPRCSSSRETPLLLPPQRDVFLLVGPCLPPGAQVHTARAAFSTPWAVRGGLRRREQHDFGVSYGVKLSFTRHVWLSLFFSLWAGVHIAKSSAWFKWLVGKDAP